MAEEPLETLQYFSCSAYGSRLSCGLGYMHRLEVSAIDDFKSAHNNEPLYVFTLLDEPIEAKTF